MSYPTSQRIFTPIRNQPLTGRNANIQPTMFKRKQIFEKQKNPKQRFQTPFSGYSFTGSSVSQSNILSRSQVSDFSTQNVIKLIKDEIEKTGINTTSQTSQQNLKHKNQLNILRIQVRSIKQSYHELNKASKKKNQQHSQIIHQLKKQNQNLIKGLETGLIQQIDQRIQQRVKQLQKDIAVKMRLVMNKAHQDIYQKVHNKLVQYTNKQFIQKSFMDVLSQQLDAIDEQIAQIKQSKIGTNQLTNSVLKRQIHQNNSSTGSQIVKLNKLQKDFENLRKSLDQSTIKIREINESIQSLSQTEDKQLKQIKQKINQLSKDLKKQLKINKSQMQTKIQSNKKSLEQKIQNDSQSFSKRIQALQSSLVIGMNMVNNNSSSPTLKNANIIGQQKSRPSLEQSLVNQYINANSQNNLQAGLQNSNSEVHHFSQKIVDPRKQKNKITITFANGHGQVININKQGQNLTNNMSSSFGKQTQTVSNPKNDGNNNRIENRNTSNIISKYILAQSSSINQNSLIIQGTNIQNSLNPTGSNLPSRIYKVDRNGYLMDNQNKYLLSPKNSMIKVSEQQIQSMEETNLIKVQRWIQDNQA